MKQLLDLAIHKLHVQVNPANGMIFCEGSETRCDENIAFYSDKAKEKIKKNNAVQRKGIEKATSDEQEILLKIGFEKSKNFTTY